VKGALTPILGFLTIIIVTAIIVGHGRSSMGLARTSAAGLSEFVSVADLQGSIPGYFRGH
jgi:hypothetical protein